MKRGLIIAGGPLSTEQLQAELGAKPDLVLAADGGGKHLLDIGVTPDVLLGDFDSLAEADVVKISAAGSKIYRFPAQKDQTDLELALGYAVQNGISQVRILGGLGRRLDHTLANIGLLQQAGEAGINAGLLEETQEVWLTGARIVIPARPGWAVSLIPLTPQVKGVTTSGLEYALTGSDLRLTATRGVHNRFNAAEAEINIKEGWLAVIIFKEE